MSLKHRTVTAADYLKRRDRLTETLFQAITNCDSSRVELLLKESVNLRARNDLGMTLLHVNAMMGSSAITRLLIKAGCKINATDREGNTPLYEAIDHKNVSVARCLIEAGADSKIQDRKWSSLLHLAVMRDDNFEYGELVRMIIQGGIDFNSANYDGNTALHIACQQNNERMFHLLLKFGADVHARNKDADTLLHLAAKAYTHPWKAGKLGIIKTLLERGCDINGQNRRGWTPLHYMIVGDKHDKPDLIRLFLQMGANVMITANIDGSAFHLAANNFNPVVLELVLQHVDNIEQKDRGGSTALMIASEAYSPENIKQLVARGADVHAKRDFGLTALFLAANKENVDFIKFVNNDLGIFRPTIDAERLETLRLLFKLGANVNDTDEEGRTILDMALEQEESDVINVIMEHVADETLLAEIQPGEQKVAIYKHPELKAHYYKKCRAELTLTKEQKINGTSASFFGILVSGVDVVARYARNSELIDAFKSSGYKTTFPIYSATLEAKLHEGIKRRKLIDNAAVVLSDTLQFADPSDVAFEKILEYLSNDDIKILVGKNE